MQYISTTMKDSRLSSKPRDRAFPGIPDNVVVMPHWSSINNDNLLKAHGMDQNSSHPSLDYASFAGDASLHLFNMESEPSPSFSQCSDERFLSMDLADLAAGRSSDYALAATFPPMHDCQTHSRAAISQLEQPADTLSDPLQDIFYNTTLLGVQGGFGFPISSFTPDMQWESTKVDCSHHSQGSPSCHGGSTSLSNLTHTAFGSQSYQPQSSASSKLLQEEDSTQSTKRSKRISPTSHRSSIRNKLPQCTNLSVTKKGIKSKKATYPRASISKVTCTQCPDTPSFRGDHELRRHIAAKHEGIVQRFICRDPATVGITSHLTPLVPLTVCKSCLEGKQYGVYYNAAAHLRRVHFQPKVRRGRNEGSALQRGGGQAGGNDLEMKHLKAWFEEVHVPVDRVSAIVSSALQETGLGNDVSHTEKETGLTRQNSHIQTLPQYETNLFGDVNIDSPTVEHLIDLQNHLPFARFAGALDDEDCCFTSGHAEMNNWSLARMI